MTIFPNRGAEVPEFINKIILTLIAGLIILDAVLFASWHWHLQPLSVVDSTPVIFGLLPFLISTNIIRLVAVSRNTKPRFVLYALSVLDILMTTLILSPIPSAGFWRCSGMRCAWRMTAREL